jgi:hypothetical protein
LSSISKALDSTSSQEKGEKKERGRGGTYNTIGKI